MGGAFPLVVSTWPFREAVRAAWDVVSAGDGGGSAVDAVVAGCSACEVLRCDGTGQSLARVILITANGARPQLSLARSRGWKQWCCFLKHIDTPKSRLEAHRASFEHQEHPSRLETQMFKHSNCFPFAVVFLICISMLSLLHAQVFSALLFCSASYISSINCFFVLLSTD